MPELPEVEVTRRRLAPLLVGRRVRDARTTRDSSVFLTRPRALVRGLRGRRIVALERHGKYLLARLEGGETLLVHLGMTGDLFAAAAAGRGSFVPDVHTHLRLRLAGSRLEVFFRDPRKFGKLQLLCAGEASPRLARLGVDALAATARRLLTATRGRRAAVKSLLLDQSVLAGVGNIYADEALFEARIRPGRRAGRLTCDECRRLAGAVKRVLRRAIREGCGGFGLGPEATSAEDGWRVYGRAGEPCRRCGTPVRRGVLAGRSAHFCPRCQR